MSHFFKDWHAWAISGGILVGALIATYVIYKLVFGFAQRFAEREGSVIDKSLVRHLRAPAKLIIPLLVYFAVLPATTLPRSLSRVLQHILGLGMIATAAWVFIVLIDVFEDVAADRYKIGIQDDLRARKIRTQIHVLRRTAMVIVIFIALSVMLMTFPSIRQFGVSLFASAGIAGLVIGMAARPTLSNLVAGVQIALTEPIRLEDVVIVEGEWGWIEEITTTYVVVRIWDLRRLVVPISYFVENPFQNWTRDTADLLGTVFIYTDYTVRVEEVRQELHRILKTTNLWDGKVWGLQVTNANEHTMELRALMSASDSPKSWDLRCYVRENLVAFLQQHYPQSLPKTRVEMESVNPAPALRPSAPVPAT
ncbi:MAG: mechanosensitive ion channel family protein [Acidobacteria bacterium]|nr:mechanosensitive ion channel family protein [Acidobacteriota bacterium]